ncbi:GNAT family N-acetyltransferase [Clostridium sp.]|uniref:GNAT family N-acetyltransferase n=1 Tax=Clostridium sp. TaxID=1506 RepID=UPI002FC79161
MIKRMSREYEEQLVEFLYKYNNLKEYSVAWIPENYGDISSYDKSNFFLCIENEKVVGALGTYISKEQNTVRLLGPIIEKQYFNQYAKSLYELCMEELPQGMEELRIAFFLDNEACTKWCEGNNFELYNAEKTMVYDSEGFYEAKVNKECKLVQYNPTYKEGLSQVHPKGVFFTLDELINEISDNHKLVLAIDDEEVVGYIYYEISEDRKNGDVVLLHVKENSRGKGYGTTLLMDTIKKLLSFEVEQIELNVRVTNYEAQKLYERVGFKEYRTIYAYKKKI